MSCPHRPDCPGCAFDELTPDAALIAKRERVRSAFGVYGALGAIAVGPCAGTSDQHQYRTRVKWAVDEDRIGLYGEDHRVVDTPHCEVAPPLALLIAEALRQEPSADELGAQLGALDIRVTARGQAAVVLVVEADSADEARAHATFLAQRLDGPLSGVAVAWSWRQPDAPTVLGGRPEPLRGESTLRDTIGLVPARFPPGAFSQAHRGQTAVLHRWLRDTIHALDPAGTATVVDLYAGTGGLGFASGARNLILVEPFAPAAEAARAEAPQTATVITGTADRVLLAGGPGAFSTRALGGDGWGRADRAVEAPILIVDPPRSGLTGDTLAAVIRARPRAIVYVSCAPETLARDLAALQPSGWTTDQARPLDLMPRTGEVETFVVLRPDSPPDLEVLAEIGGDVFLAKPPFLPTIPHPEWPVSLLELALRSRPGLKAAHRLDVNTSGVIVLSPRGSVAIEGGEKRYTALVRGVVRRHGTIRLPLEDRGERLAAETHYQRLEVVGGHSLLCVTLATGRTHQIRRHFAAIGHPVLGDDRYGDARSNRYLFAVHGLQRPFLHASGMRLAGQADFVECPLWPDLQAALDHLRGKAPAPTDPESFVS